MVIVCVCVGECQFALIVMDSLVDVLKPAHVHSMRWMRGRSPPARNDGLMDIKWVQPVVVIILSYMLCSEDGGSQRGN